MLKIKLKEELKKINNLQTDESQAFINEVKLLMANNNQIEKETLIAVNLGSNIIKAEKQTEKMITFKEINDKYEGDVYTLDQIKHLAIKYNLRFLRTNQFTGHVAAEVGSVLVRFCEKNLINAKAEANNFYILAPAKMFKLNNRPVDPLLFYRINNRNGEDMYKLVYKWGEDFTLFRRINGWFSENNIRVTLKYLLYFTFALMSIVTLSYLIFSNTIFNIISIGGIILCLVSYIFIIVDSSFDKYYKKTSEYNWNNEFNS